MFTSILKKRKEIIENKEREQYRLQVGNKAKSYIGKYLRCVEDGVCFKLIGEIRANSIQSTTILSCKNQYGVTTFFNFSNYKHTEFANFEKYGIGQSFNNEFVEITERDYIAECVKADNRFNTLQSGDLLYEKNGFNVAVVKHVYSFGFNNMRQVVCDLFDLRKMEVTNKNIDYSFKYFDTHYTAGKYEYVNYSNPSLDRIIGKIKKEYKEEKTQLLND